MKRIILLVLVVSLIFTCTTEISNNKNKEVKESKKNEKLNNNLVSIKAYENLTYENVINNYYSIKFNNNTRGVTEQLVNYSEAMDIMKRDKIDISHIDFHLVKNEEILYSFSFILPNSYDTSSDYIEEYIQYEIDDIVYDIEESINEFNFLLTDETADTPEDIQSYQNMISALENELLYINRQYLCVIGFSAVIIDNKMDRGNKEYELIKHELSQKDNSSNNRSNNVSGKFEPNWNKIKIKTKFKKHKHWWGNTYTPKSRIIKWKGYWKSSSGNINRLHTGPNPCFEPDVKIEAGWAFGDPWIYRKDARSNLPHWYVDSNLCDDPSEMAYTIGSTEANAIVADKTYYTKLELYVGITGRKYNMKILYQHFTEHIHGWEADPWSVGTQYGDAYKSENGSNISGRIGDGKFVKDRNEG